MIYGLIIVGAASWVWFTVTEWKALRRRHARQVAEMEQRHALERHEFRVTMKTDRHANCKNTPCPDCVEGQLRDLPHEMAKLLEELLKAGNANTRAAKHLAKERLAAGFLLMLGPFLLSVKCFEPGGLV